MDKFCALEDAFRTLSKHNNSTNDYVDKIIFDIKHTAPQHRQYLSFEGVGHGTPSQRMKQWTQARAQTAAENVMEHRISKALASEGTLMKKGEYAQKHDIKTKYGFDRLVEDLIQESISKGEFENLKGIGKPLKDQNCNPYVDFTTHKLNEVLINNGFTPEWITMNKEIEQDVERFKQDLQVERLNIGSYPLNEEDQERWDNICKSCKTRVKEINSRITTYNLIVPLINKQKFLINFDKIANEILQNGKHSDPTEQPKTNKPKISNQNEDMLVSFIRTIGDIFR